MTDFELSDGIFAKAEIKKPKAVGIWLGANVMVEYNFEEAIELLEKNLSTARKVPTTRFFIHSRCVSHIRPWLLVSEGH